jgi:hypothetical protein
MNMIIIGDIFLRKAGNWPKDHKVLQLKTTIGK